MGSCTTWGTTGFYWQQLEPIRVGQAGCSPLYQSCMLWLGRLCSLLIADSSLTRYCQQSAHLEAVFFFAASILHAVSFTVGLRSGSSCCCCCCCCPLSKSSTATSFWGGIRNLAKLTHKHHLLRRANTAHTQRREFEIKETFGGPSSP